MYTPQSLFTLPYFYLLPSLEHISFVLICHSLTAFFVSAWCITYTLKFLTGKKLNINLPVFFWVNCKLKYSGTSQGCTSAGFYGNCRAVFCAVVSVLSVFNQAKWEESGPFPWGDKLKVGQHLTSPSNKISQLEEASCQDFHTSFSNRVMLKEGTNNQTPKMLQASVVCWHTILTFKVSIFQLWTVKRKWLETLMLSTCAQKNDCWHKNQPYVKLKVFYLGCCFSKDPKFTLFIYFLLWVIPKLLQLGITLLCCMHVLKMTSRDIKKEK